MTVPVGVATELNPDVESDESWVRLLSHELGGPIALLAGYASMWGELGARMRRDTDTLCAELAMFLTLARPAPIVADASLQEAFRRFDSLARPAAQRLTALLEHAENTRPVADCRRAAVLIVALLDQLGIALKTSAEPPPRKTPIELNMWTRELVHRIAAPAAARAHRLLMCGTREPARATVVLPEMLEAAVLNLVDNAQKHSPPGTTIRVSVQRLDGVAGVQVADRGPGLPDAALHPRPFHRVEQPLAFALPGLGLGLLIAARVAQRNCGRLLYAPRVGGGAEFTLELPRIR